jgi:hypothetical protein
MYAITNDIICFYANIIKNVIYDIIQKPMISCMVSHLFDNIMVIYPFLAILFYDFAYDIIYISYKICYDISIL